MHRSSSVVMTLMSLLIIVFSFPAASHAADTLGVHITPITNKSISEKIGDDISLFTSDLGSFITSPLHFSGTDWAITGGILGSTVALMPLDNWAQSRAQAAPHTSGFESFMTESRHYGEIVIAGSITGAAYFGGILFDDPWLRTTGRELIEALAYSGITTTAFKYLIARARPYLDQGSHSFLPFDITNGHNSLPSGHTTVAFALSTILSERINNIWASALLYGAASCTAFSRMYHNQHWLSDVFMGAAIGTTTGIFVAHRDEKRNELLHASATEFSISPTVGGLQAQLKF
jgi:membrane-associated phospholipid phosphatase